MKLIHIYIQQVVRHLPMKRRQAVEAELLKKIEALLPTAYDEKDVEQALNTLGDPQLVADRYKGTTSYLIGPRYFHTYWSLVKTVIPIVVVVLAVLELVTLLTIEQMAVGTALVQLLSSVFTNITQLFFGLTIAFILIERFSKNTNDAPKQWSVQQLQKVKLVSGKKVIPHAKAIWHAVGTVIWLTAYFYAPKLLAVYEMNNDDIRYVSSAVNEDVLFSFWPIVVVVAILELVIAVWKFIEKQWTIRLAIAQTITELVKLVTVIVIFTAPNLWNPLFIEKLTSRVDAEVLSWGLTALLFLLAIGTIMTIIDSFKRAFMRTNLVDIENRHS